MGALWSLVDRNRETVLCERLSRPQVGGKKLAEVEQTPGGLNSLEDLDLRYRTVSHAQKKFPFLIFNSK